MYLKFFYLPVAIYLGFLLIKVIKKNVNPDNKNVMVYSFFYGFAIAIIIYIINMFFRNFLYSFLSSGKGYPGIILFYVIFLIIEIVKYIVFRIFFYKSDKYRSIIDGIIFSVILTLGFLVPRSIFFNIDYYYSMITGYLNIFLPVISGIFSAIIFGYFIGLEKFQEKNKIEFHLIGIGGAVLINGGINFLSSLGTIIVVILLAAGSLLLFRLSKEYI